MQIRVLSQSKLCIVYDEDRVQSITQEWFDPNYWQNHGTETPLSGGRGGARFIQGDFGKAVLKQYHRGGLLAKLVRDQYLFTGFRRCRAIAEFYLLTQMRVKGLPVPNPIAACCQRRGLLARMAIITGKIPHKMSLAQSLQGEPLEDHWLEAGRVIQRFHQAGVMHGDLNLHNILVDERGAVFLIDFDKSRIMRPKPGWQQANIRRLCRSLEKLAPEHKVKENLWGALIKGYKESSQ